MDKERRVALVTGASSGFGLLATVELARRGERRTNRINGSSPAPPLSAAGDFRSRRAKPRWHIMGCVNVNTYRREGARPC